MYGHEGIGARYSSEDLFRGADFRDIFRDLDFGFGGINDIFDVFFGRQRRYQQGPERGSDLAYDLEITLEDVASGYEREINIPRSERCDVCNGTGAAPGTTPKRCTKCNGTGQAQHVTSSGFGQFIQIVTCNVCEGQGTIIESLCPKCQGTGILRRSRKILVKIPPGIEEGSRMRLVGEGEVGTRGGNPGDLYVIVHVQPHNVFKQKNNDIEYETRIGFTQAALGTEIEVPTISGRAKLKIPPGTQNDTIFRLRGKGLPRLQGFGHGDELIHVTIVIPTKLTSRQRELLTQLAKELGEEVNKPSLFFM
jgi:molecular chaperone DnaJ